jgi:hypothetical protein
MLAVEDLSQNTMTGQDLLLQLARLPLVPLALMGLLCQETLSL